MFQTCYRENENTHVLFSYFFKSLVYEIMFANNVEPDSLQMTIWRMCMACWIP